jgi:hypothetical protein
MTLDQPWSVRLGPEGNVYVSRSHLHGKSGPGQLHLTNARIFEFDVDSGNMVRAYILGVDSGIQHPTGFAFVPGDGFDCNLNLVPDSCDIESGFSLDENGNGIPDECESCTGDVDGNGTVDTADLVALLAAWGAPGGPADLDGNGVVDTADLVILLASWGSCA